MFSPSDCLARVRTGLNALGWYPVYLNDVGHAYVERYGKWEPVGGIAGFENYEPAKTKSKPLYDTSTGELIAV
jgi:hypothetical protein